MKWRGPYLTLLGKEVQRIAYLLPLQRGGGVSIQRFSVLVIQNSGKIYEIRMFFYPNARYL